MSSSELTAVKPLKSQVSSARTTSKIRNESQDGAPTECFRRNRSTESWNNGGTGNSTSERFLRDRRNHVPSRDGGGIHHHSQDFNKMNRSNIHGSGSYRGSDKQITPRDRLRTMPPQPSFHNQFHQSMSPPPPPPPPRGSYPGLLSNFPVPIPGPPALQIGTVDPKSTSLYQSIPPSQHFIHNPPHSQTYSTPTYAPTNYFMNQYQVQSIPPPPPPPPPPSHRNNIQGTPLLIHSQLNTSVPPIQQNTPQTQAIHLSFGSHLSSMNLSGTEQPFGPSHFMQYPGMQVLAPITSSTSLPPNGMMQHDTRSLSLAQNALLTQQPHPNTVAATSLPSSHAPAKPFHPGYGRSDPSKTAQSFNVSAISQTQTPMIVQSTTGTVNSSLVGVNNPENVPSNWSTHTAPSGVYYYYNSITQTSTYTRPSCLGEALNTTVVSNSSTANSSSTTVPSTAPLSCSQQEKKWVEYVDPTSGKKYYYDGTTTTWDKPPDYVEVTTEITGKKRSIMDGDNEDKDETAKQKKKSSETTVSIYQNKAEAIAAFKGMLLAKGVTPTMKWNDVVKLCTGDARWESCPGSVGERKQALAEYQAKRANELRDEKRLEKIRAKDAFLMLLTEMIPALNGTSSSSCDNFSDFRTNLAKDDRFFAVEEESEREEIFYEFMEELRKRDERQRRNRKRDAKEAFLSFLKFQEESGLLSFASTWSTFIASLEESSRSDNRFAVSPFMSDSDRQLYFADYVIQLHHQEDEKKRRIRDARKRAEKAQRDAYRDILRNLCAEGSILPSTDWHKAQELLSSHESFGPVQGQDKEAPRVLFEDFIGEWKDCYKHDKGFLSHICAMSEPRLNVTHNMRFEEFRKLILENAGRSPDLYSEARRIFNQADLPSSAKLYFDEMKSTKESSRRSKAKFDLDEGEVMEDGEVTEDIELK